MAKKKPKYDRIIAIDLGNGLINVRSEDDDGDAYSFTLPSAYALANKVGDKQVNGREFNLNTYIIDNIEYVWGKDIEDFPDIIPTGGYKNRYRSENFKIICKIVMAKVIFDLGIEAKEKILIVTGVPSDETDTPAEDDIKEAFFGTHEDHVHSVGYFDGEEEESLVFTVSQVAVLPQATSTILGRFLNENGDVLDVRYKTRKVGVIDIGGGTIDLDSVFELNRQKGFHSVQKGFNDVYEGIREYIASQGVKAKPSDYQLLKIINDVAEQKKNIDKEYKDDPREAEKQKKKLKYIYSQSDRAKKVDFTKVLNDGIKELVLVTQQAIQSKWKNPDILDEILLVGGSAELFKPYLAEIIDYGVTVPENHGESNVEGYFRYGKYVIKHGDEE